jgi:hypothetical protein
VVWQRTTCLECLLAFILMMSPDIVSPYVFFFNSSIHMSWKRERKRLQEPAHSKLGVGALDLYRQVKSFGISMGALYLSRRAQGSSTSCPVTIVSIRLVNSRTAETNIVPRIELYTFTFALRPLGPSAYKFLFILVYIFIYPGGCPTTFMTFY